MKPITQKSRLCYVRDSRRRVFVPYRAVEKAETDTTVLRLQVTKSKIMNISLVPKGHRNASFMSVVTPNGHKRKEEWVPDVFMTSGPAGALGFRAFNEDLVSFPRESVGIYWGGFALFDDLMDNDAAKPADLYDKTDLQQVGLLTEEPEKDLDKLVTEVTVRGLNSAWVPPAGELLLGDRLDRFEGVLYSEMELNENKSITFKFAGVKLKYAHIKNDPVVVIIPVTKPSGKTYLGRPSRDGQYQMYLTAGEEDNHWIFSAYSLLTGDIRATQEVDLTIQTGYIGSTPLWCCDEDKVYVIWQYSYLIGGVLFKDFYRMVLDLPDLSVSAPKTKIATFNSNDDGGGPSNIDMAAQGGECYLCLSFNSNAVFRATRHVVLNASTGSIVFDRTYPLALGMRGSGMAVSAARLWTGTTRAAAGLPTEQRIICLDRADGSVVIDGDLLWTGSNTNIRIGAR